MALELFASNLATTTVSSGGTDAPAQGTQETWTVASSSMFGTAATGVSQFHVADAAVGGNGEIIAVTNVSGTTWTVTRGAENTTPVVHYAGFTVYQVVTAGFLTSLVPLTTLGDILYENSTPAPARLAGNTTATKNFLTQTGTGSASATPAWGTIAASDVPGVQGVAITAAEATLVSDLNNATARSATATLLPGEETIFTGSTASQTLTLPASPPSSSVNTVTNAASVSVTLAPGAGATLSNFGASGNIVIPSGYVFAVVYIGSTWYVQSAGPSDFAKNSALAIGNGGTGATTAAAAYNALSPMTTKGDLEIESSAGTAGRLPVGSAGQVLGVSAGLPAWGTGMTQLAATAVGGYTLVNGTGTIISWTAPNDGALHRVLVMATLHVTSSETAGQINATGNLPDGTAFSSLVITGGNTTGTIARAVMFFSIEAGTTVSVIQDTALAGGAAVLWAELWGS